MRAIDTIMDSESSDADEGVENVGKNDRALHDRATKQYLA